MKKYENIIFNCQQCGDEMSADKAIESFKKRGFVTCKCCDEPTYEDNMEYFAYLIESKQIIVA